MIMRYWVKDRIEMNGRIITRTILRYSPHHFIRIKRGDMEQSQAIFKFTRGGKLQIFLQVIVILQERAICRTYPK